LHFAIKDPLYEIEKPYTCSYEPPGVPQTNLTYQAIDGVEIRDLRYYPLSYSERGIGVTRLETSLSYVDFDDLEKVEAVYLREARMAIGDALCTRDVHILDYLVSTSGPARCVLSDQAAGCKIRRRGFNYPLKPGDSFDPGKIPLLGAHGGLHFRSVRPDIAATCRSHGHRLHRERCHLPYETCIWRQVRGFALSVVSVAKVSLQPHSGPIGRS
jgi:hypothetical protein